MILHPTQEQAGTDKHRFRVWNCGRRWGKTTAAVEEMKAQALAKEARIAYIAPTFQQARDIAWELLKKELNGSDINESRLELRLPTKHGTSTIFLRGWEAIETLRGQRFDLLILDEVASMRNFWANWHEVLRPTLTDTRGQAIFISTPKGFNHFYDLYNFQDKDKDFKSFHFTTYDNPFIPKDEIEKAKLELPEDRFAQEYLADFRKTEGLVYKDFNRQFDLFDKAPDNLRVICGVDFGFTNPTAVIKIGIDHDETYWVLDEWYKSGQTTEQIIEVIQRFRPQATYADPAEPDRISQLQRAGINCRETNKDIEAGIDRVRELMKQRRLKIQRECRNLILELETYSYPEKRANNNEPETPIKENDHAVDALRYAIYSHRTMAGNPFTNKPTFFR